MHIGHVELVVRAQALFGFDRVLVVPCGRHALEKKYSVSDEQRLAMLSRAFEPYDFVAIDTLEIERSGASYTLDTCRAIRERYPADPVCLLVGSDILPDLHRWYQWQAIFDEVNLAIFERTSPSDSGADFSNTMSEKPSYSFALSLDRVRPAAQIRQQLESSYLSIDGSMHLVEGLVRKGATYYLPVVLPPVSSTEIRAALGRRGQDEYDDVQLQASDLAYLASALEPSVWEYIRAGKLYTSDV